MKTMQITLYKNQKTAGAKNGLSAFATGLLFIFLFSFSFQTGLCGVRPLPTEATDHYSLEDNEFIDGQTKSLIYDTGVVVGDDLDINGQSIFVKGNIYFKAANGETLHVNVGQNTPGNQVTIQPFANKIVKHGTALTTEEAPDELSPGETNDDIETTRNYAHLCFCPDNGGTIEVNLFKDLCLTGSNYSQNGAHSITGKDGSGNPLTITTDDLVTDMTMSFTGEGQTIFKFADGKALIMESTKWDSETNAYTFNDLRDGINAGVRVLVAMDQNKDAVVTKGRNKVVFQRIDYNGGNQNTVVRVGRNCFLTYCSTNIDGLDTTAESYGAIAFDVSNTGEGRFELQITGSDTSGTYVDGSIQICGSFLGHIDDTDPTNPTPVSPAASYDNPFDFSGIDPETVHKSFGKTKASGVDFSQPAGSQAFMRIIDKLAYSSDSDYRDALNPNSGEVGVKSGGTHTRRGLLIVNNNYSIPPFAANSYSDAGWFYSNGPTYVNNIGANKILPYRPGFILGVNGHIEVSHNTFMEYEALSVNIEIEPARNGFLELDTKITNAGITDPGVVLKKHNPSAFIVDGLETILRFENPTTHVAIDPAVELIHFKAHTSDTVVRHAQISLLGNASFTCRGPLLANQGVYDGYRLPVPNTLDSSGNVSVYGETAGEGVHVMDIEGLFSIRSINDATVADPAGFGWHAGTNYTKSGAFRLGSIYRTFDDREAKSHLTLVPEFNTRPLLIDKTYSRYDKPSILTNASFDFIDLNFHNEDITRDVIPDPLQADPIFLGGEKATFSADVDLNPNPDISFWRIYNSTIHCHESMCISGIRLLVRELPTYHTGTSDEGSNTSKIIFYNHGSALDTAKKGYGRLFMFGTNNNEVAAGGTSPYLSSAFANIFRHTGQAIATATPNAFKNKDSILKLQTSPEVPSGTSLDEKGMHMLILGNASYLDIGWTSTVGLTKSSPPGSMTIYPFDHINPATVTQANQFVLRTTTVADGAGEKPAELAIDGDFIFFGARDANGKGSPRTVDDFNVGRVLYVGHGGKLSIGSDLKDPLNPRPYIGFADATIAVRIWKEKVGERGLSAILELPGDQMKHSNPIHPYGLNLNTLTDTDNKYLSLKSLIGQGLGSEICISWDKVSGVPTVPTSALPWETILGSFFDGTRAISTIHSPVTMPDQGLLQMTSGDLVDQLTVSGSTPANPFKLYMTGDNTGISQMREIASVKSDSLVPGEGAYAKLYLDGGAELGLGTRHWNSESAGAWNKIGLSQVLLHPNGDCAINVNSDLIVFDPQPVVPTNNFGSQYKGRKIISGQTVDAVISPSHRVTFFAQNSNEIRIPAGKELDLSAFGQAHEMTAGEAGTGTVLENLPPFTQSIAIGGKLRIIFEPGSTLRFPNLGDATASATDKENVEKMPVLYMNEESELVFEALQDLDNKAAWTSVSDLNRAKVKIVGCGQIWLNKHAKMTINDNAFVSVEADSYTKNTNLTISIQREAAMNIGDTNNAGGSFHVGNPTNISGANIDFTLRFSGESSQLMIGRNGFLGFGAATVNRTSTQINKWTLAPLFNVRNVNIRNVSGIINHNRIFEGSDRESSLLAIGPCNQYLLEFGEKNAILKGGGNVVYVRPDPTTSPFPISILSTVSPLVEDVTDNAKYTILSTSESMKQILAPPTGFKIDTVIEKITTENSTALSDSVLTSGDVSGLVNGMRVKAGQVDFYKFISAGGINDIKNQNPKRFTALCQTPMDERIGYVNNGTIVRTPGFTMQNETNVADGLSYGALKVATRDTNENPTSFIPPGR